MGGSYLTTQKLPESPNLAMVIRYRSKTTENGAGSSLRIPGNPLNETLPSKDMWTPS